MVILCYDYHSSKCTLFSFWIVQNIYLYQNIAYACYKINWRHCLDSLSKRSEKYIADITE